MSRREIERAHVMRAIQERRLTQKQAASQLVLSVRQVERLFARYKRDGPTGLVSRQRGQRNHVLPEWLREEALSIVRTRCRHRARPIARGPSTSATVTRNFQAVAAPARTIRGARGR